MSRRTATWLAWGAWAFDLAMAAATIGFQMANDPATLWFNLVNVLVRAVFATVGLLIASRRPENLIGWLFLLQALLSESGWLGIEYAVYGLLSAPGALPAAAWVGLLGLALRTISFSIAIGPLVLLFPDGRLLSRRWRVVVWLFLASTLLLVISAVLDPGGFDPRLGNVAKSIELPVAPELIELAKGAAGLVTLLSVAASVAAIVLRFRCARGDERQQLKWFAYAAFIALAFLLVFESGPILLLPSWSPPQNVGSLLFSLAIVGFPISAGIAILKYRLYDIDLIIRRTLIYSVLSFLLLIVYFGSVLLLQEIVHALTGARQSEIVTVISTLAIAALFTPLRQRVQSFIDRRFYRRKYDARQVLEAFSASVRDEVDLARLSDHLLAVVGETMQPAHMSLWLRKTEREVKR